MSTMIETGAACGAWELDSVKDYASPLAAACRVVWEEDLRADTKRMHWLGSEEQPQVSDCVAE